MALAAKLARQQLTPPTNKRPISSRRGSDASGITAPKTGKPQSSMIDYIDYLEPVGNFLLKLVSPAINSITDIQGSVAGYGTKATTQAVLRENNTLPTTATAPIKATKTTTETATHPTIEDREDRADKLFKEAGLQRAVLLTKRQDIVRNIAYLDLEKKLIL